jgi:hypothetical protein
MMKWTKLAIGGSLIAVALGVSSFQLGVFEVMRLNTRVRELEEEKTRLVEFARRLGASRRMAQIDVIDQVLHPAGHTVTRLRWQQIGHEGALGVPEPIEITGTLAYIEALVIKFDPQHVGEGDPARGASLAMFRRAFGDLQPPDTGARLDREVPPTVAREPDEAKLHARLWNRFWEFVEDPDLAAEYGVRVAQIEAPAVPVKPGQIWEVTLDAAGGLNIRKMGYRAPSQPSGRETSARAGASDDQN